MSSSGSTTVHNIEINYITRGLDVYSTQASSAAISSEKLAGSTTKVAANIKTSGDSFAKSGTSVKAYSGAIAGLEPSINKAVGGLTKKNTVLGSSIGQYNNAAVSAENLGGKINKFSNSILPLVSRVSGLSFALVGWNAAMAEAQGMQEILALSQAKVAQLQAEQNQLLEDGQEGTREYNRVTSELQQAQAAMTRQQTIYNLSLQDTYFFIGAIVAQSIPTAVRGVAKLTEIMSKSEKGFGAITDLIKGKTTGAIVSLAEKTGLLPVVFTSAGTSANTFGMALKALALNPFTIAIVAATTALSLFVTNAFGFRDAVYGIGKAIGDAVPFLKPLLEGMKAVGDFIVTSFGGQIPEAMAESTKSVNDFNTKLSETEIHVLGMSKGVEVLTNYAQEWEHLQGILNAGNDTVISFITAWDELNKAIENADVNTTGSIDNIMKWLMQLESAASEASPEIVEAISQIWTILAMPPGKAKQEELAKQIGKINVLIKESKSATGEAKLAFDTYNASIEYNAKYVEKLASLHGIKLNPELLRSQSNVSSLKKHLDDYGVTTDKTSDILAEYILKGNEVDTLTKSQLLNLQASMPVWKEFGDNIVFTNEKTVDMTSTLENFTLEQQIFASEATAIWNKYSADIAKGTISTEAFGKMIESIRVTSPQTADALDEILKGYLDGTKKATKTTADWTAEFNKLIGEVLRIQDEGIPAINAFAEKLKSIDDAVKTVVEQLRGQAKEALIKAVDKSGKDFDDVLKKMKLKISDAEKINIFKEVFIFDTDADNEVTSLVERLGKAVLAGSDKFGPESGNKMMKEIFKGMKKEAGNNQTLLDEIKKWEDGFKNVSGLSGEAYSKAFIEYVVNNFGSQKGVVDGLAKLFGADVVNGVIMGMKEKNPDLQIAGQESGATITQGTTDGLGELPGAIDSEVTPAVKDSMVLMTAEAIGLVNTMLDDEVNTTIPGYATLFATAFTNLGATAINFVTEAAKHIGTFNLILFDETTITLPGFATILANLFTQMGTSVTQMVDTTKIQMLQFNQAITASEGRINDFVNKSSANLVKLRTAFGNFGTSVSAFKNQFIKDMDSASSKFDSFTSKMLANLVKLRTGFGNATTQAGELKKAIDALKDKTITVTTKYKTEGSPNKRFGGSFINSIPTKVGSTNISEGGKPELVTITPLTDPHTNDTAIDFGAFKPNLAERKIDTSLAAAPSINKIVGSSGNVSSQIRNDINNIMVKGLMQVNLTLPNGRVLAKMIMPYMMEGMAGSL